MNWAAVSSCVPKVSCVFFFVSRSRRKSFWLPLIRALSGRADVHHIRETALLGRDLGPNDQREDYLRARLEIRVDGELIALPVTRQDSSLLGNLAAARALLIRPPFAPAVATGTTIEFLRLPE